MCRQEATFHSNAGLAHFPLACGARCTEMELMESFASRSLSRRSRRGSRLFCIEERKSWEEALWVNGEYCILNPEFRILNTVFKQLIPLNGCIVSNSCPIVLPFGLRFSPI